MEVNWRLLQTQMHQCLEIFPILNKIFVLFDSIIKSIFLTNVCLSCMKDFKHQITFDIFIVLNILNIQSYGSFNVDERSGGGRAAVRSDVRSVTGGGGVRSALGFC